MTEQPARLFYYLQFDLDDAEAVKAARAALSQQLPAEAQTSLLARESVAVLRAEMGVAGEELAGLLDLIDRLGDDSSIRTALTQLVVLAGPTEAHGRQFLERFCEGEPVRLDLSCGRLSGCRPRSQDARRAVLLECDPSQMPEELLAEGLPALDLALRRLEVQAARCREEANRISRSRRASDDAIGRILHENVVMRKSGGGRIEQMHAETVELTSIYGLLASDSVILQEELDSLGDARRAAAKTIGRIGGNVESGFASYERVAAGADSEFSEYVDRTASDGQLRVEGEQGYLHTSLDKAKTAIDVVRTHVELDRSEQNLKLQERALALQVAAGFVEFVLVFYYVLHSWEPLAGTHVFEAIPAWIRFAVILAFSGGVVAATDQIAEAIRERGRRRWIAVGVLLAVLVLLVASMFGLSAFYGSAG